MLLLAFDDEKAKLNRANLIETEVLDIQERAERRYREAYERLTRDSSFKCVPLLN